MSLGRVAKLNTGAVIPRLGFGTWQSSPGEVGAAVYEALKAGYRHLDFAKVYGNQTEIAGALKKAFGEGIKRQDVFITSKLWNSQHRPEDVPAALDDCLNELGLDYLDLYLVHFPIAFDQEKNVHQELFPLSADGKVKINDNVSIIDTWKAMTKLPKEKVRAVGVSNHTKEHIEALIEATGVTPAANQIERHPRLPQTDFVKWMASKGIHTTSYSTFGNNMFKEPLLLEHDTIKAIAKKNNATPGQVILAWAQVGDNVSVIPKSVTPSRIKANFEDIELSDEDFQKIEQIGTDSPMRFNVPFKANDPVWPCQIWGDEKERDAPHHVIVGKA